MSAALRVDQLTVRYGGVTAVDSVDMVIEPGQLVGLIGPNGAGKTSLIDALTGFTPASGQIVFDGHRIDSLAAHARARRGLGRTWQSLELFDDLNVRENAQVAAQESRWWDVLRDAVLPPKARPADERADEALAALGIQELAEKEPSELSHGQRKLVGVARALAARPMVLCLDEPAAGLDPAESKQLGQRLRGMVDGGLTGLLVDHDMALVLGVCDVIYVLEFGKIIAQGTPQQIRADDRVIAAYLGTSGSSEDVDEPIA